MRPLPALLRSLSTAVLLLLPGVAGADARLDFLSAQLEKGKDPRVRAQAALVLATSGDPRALTPLCKCVGDESPLVRRACAKGLGELTDIEAIRCLAPRKDDPDASAKAEVRRVLGQLEAIKNRPPRLYLALGVAPKSGATVGEDALRMTEGLLRKNLVLKGVLLAPPKESKAAAQAVMKQKKVRAFMLNVGLESLDGGALRMTGLCLTYPDKKILGEVSAKAAGAEATDLVQALVPRLLADAAQTFDWSL